MIYNLICNQIFKIQNLNYNYQFNRSTYTFSIFAIQLLKLRKY